MTQIAVSVETNLPKTGSCDQPAYLVGVRALCAFVAKQGDLDLRFTPSPSASEGVAGHAEVAGRRGTGYQREITLKGEFGNLRVRGRADGYDCALNRLEEVKTYRGTLESMRANHRHLHWAQARVYAWLLCCDRQLAGIHVALVYFNVDTQEETVLSEWHEAGFLQQNYESMCTRFTDWADRELVHRRARDRELARLSFPHGQFRPGQRLLAEAVYRANGSGRCLLAEAPTGIGKTAATLFPVLKACPDHGLDKVFFLTAKTPGRQIAIDALHHLQRGCKQGSLRVLELVARDKACEHPENACHGASCPLAAGFFDRLPAARLAATDVAMLDKHSLKKLARDHSVCPYYLAQEMVRWSDVVVGDYNHFFDLSAMLHAFTVDEGWRVSVLVDEAHNLVERARQMYTAELDQHSFLRIRSHAPQVLKKPFARVSRRWNALVKDQREMYSARAVLPVQLLADLRSLAAEATSFCADGPTAANDELMNFAFDVMHFLRVADLHGSHAVFDVTLVLPSPGRRSAGSRLCIRNVVPAPMLKTRWAVAHSATLFSATLSPRSYFLQMLGLPEATVCIDVPSPFQGDQLEVNFARHISTRYRDRQKSLERVVALISGQYRQRPGNYLAFFSSFEYLDMVAGRLQAVHPDIAVWCQSRNMREADREAFLARFTLTSQHIGFAVLGGAFAEGVDLPGSRLIGAFIATLGLPPVDPVNEQIRTTTQAVLGNGYACTYTYPGIQKVVQAAGRIIRGADDRGYLHLMDDRFAKPEIRALLPRWWRTVPTRDCFTPR